MVLSLRGKMPKLSRVLLRADHRELRARLLAQSLVKSFVQFQSWEVSLVPLLVLLLDMLQEKHRLPSYREYLDGKNKKI